MTVFLVTIIGEALGSVGQLRMIPLVVASGVVGTIVALVTSPRRSLSRGSVAIAIRDTPDLWALSAAISLACAIGAQWLAWTAEAMRRGMFAYDALWYHSPIAARFAQSGSVTQIQPVVPGQSVSYYPATSELWHAIGIVLFRDDVLSPLLNLAALAVAILAAWCVGRRFGGAPVAVAGVALILAAPYVAITVPGGTHNDMTALAALLAATALLSRAPPCVGGRGFGRVRVADNEDPDPVSAETERGDPLAGALAAVAAGLAAGIKSSFLPPALILACAAVLLARRGCRVETALRWAALMFAAGGYWYARNLLRVGNPIPGVSLLGVHSPSFPIDARYGATLLAHHLAGSVYREGLRGYFGRPWPALPAIVTFGIVLAVVAARRSRWHCAIAVTIVGGVLAYAATPYTGDLLLFGLSLKYSLPVQGLAVLAIATVPAMQSRLAQRLLVGCCVLVVVAMWPGPPTSRRGLAEVGGWPTGAAHRAAALAVALAAVIVVGFGLLTWRVVEAAARRRLGSRPGVESAALRSGGAAVLAFGLVGVMVAGRGLQERYDTGRYLPNTATRRWDAFAPPDLQDAWAMFRDIHGVRVGVAGIYQQYPFTGSGVSNFVQYVGVRANDGGFASAANCEAWTTAVNLGHYQYIVTGRDGLGAPPGEPPEAAWTRNDPATRVLLHEGSTAVFALSGPLHVSACKRGK